MIFLGKNSLNELKVSVMETVTTAIQKALHSFKDEEKDAINLTTTVNDLKKQLRTVKDELDDVKSKKKIELMEIEHLVKMKEEKNAIELEKKTVEIQKQYNEKEMTLLKEHHAKTLSMIDDTKKEFNNLYKEILSRLPNLNATIELGGKKAK